MFRLDNKVVLVTGAARGIGAASARALAAQGASVALADVDLDGARKVAEEFRTNARAYALDVSRVPELKACVEAVVRDFGGIDVLVNNAGICPRLPFMESTEEDWDRLMAVNAKSQFFLIQAVCPVMKKRGGGRIINIASSSGRVGSVANGSIYSGSKGAIVMFSKSIAREVATDGILINCVAPGTVNTDLMQNLPPGRLEAIYDQIPLKRLAEPEEVAALVVFLASDENSYATGATFDINGGWIML